MNELELLKKELDEACRGLTPLESALLIAEAMRETGLKINLSSDGAGEFVIEQIK